MELLTLSTHLLPLTPVPTGARVAFAQCRPYESERVAWLETEPTQQRAHVNSVRRGHADHEHPRATKRVCKRSDPIVKAQFRVVRNLQAAKPIVFDLC